MATTQARAPVAIERRGIAAIDLPAYPWWSLAVFALDVLAVYGLVAHGIRSAD